MNLSQIATCLLAASVVCWGATMLLPKNFGSGWTDEKDTRYRAVAEQVHPHGDSKSAAEAAKTAQQEIDEMQAEYDAAIGRAAMIRTLLKTGCILMGLAGIGCYVVGRKST